MEFVSEQPGEGGAASSAHHYHGHNRAENGIPGKLRGCLGARIVADGGNVIADGERLSVSDATAATIYVDIATSYRRFDDVYGDPEALSEARLDTAQRKGLDGERADHIAEHCVFF